MIGVYPKFGTCQEQGGERVRLAIVQFWVRDKQPWGVITDRRFLHVSEVGPVCNEIGIRVEIAHGRVSMEPRDHQIIVEEFSESPRTEAAL